MLRKLFSRLRRDETPQPDEALVVVPMPPLVTLLIALRRDKGGALTESEVLQARDGAVCMTMRASAAHELEARRGYRDLDPENVWADWQSYLGREQSARDLGRVSDRLKAEAKANPGGWVYEVAGGYDDSEAVPPQAIKGAWQVDEHGEVVGKYQANPNYDPAFRKPVRPDDAD